MITNMKVKTLKMTKITIEEMIQLIKKQIELDEERFKYEKELKELYKLCKKSIWKKLQESWQNNEYRWLSQ